MIFWWFFNSKILKTAETVSNISETTYIGVFRYEKYEFEGIFAIRSLLDTLLGLGGLKIIDFLYLEIYNAEWAKNQSV